MYLDFFGIQTKPFAIVPDERFFYLTAKHREALAHLLYGIRDGSGFVMLTGEVGTGKTMVCRCLLAEMPADIEVALCLNPKLTDLELLAVICDELRVAYPQPPNSRKELVDRINAHLLESYGQGRRVVLIIDEAQDLEPAVLEQVRLLTNLETASTKLLQIVLVGQHELLEILSRQEMRQVAQRITARYHLMPLTRDETGGYIRHRLEVAGLWPGTFKPAAVKEIFKASGGVPRLINVICDRCLLGAYAKGVKAVDAGIARAAAREVLGKDRGGRGRSRLVHWMAAAAAGVLVAGLVLADPLGLGLARGVEKIGQALTGAPSGPVR
ncbi:MAG: AAA family ATPase [Magnetospirillum sp. WYHS-4]